MRKTLLAAMAFAGWVGYASAQSMPGTPVGSSMVMPVGTRLPDAGSRLPTVGKPPAGSNSTSAPFSGQWPTVDKNLVVAPYPSSPPQSDPNNFWDKLYDRWKMMFKEPEQPPPTYTPGIARRNRERREKEAKLELQRRMRD